MTTDADVLEAPEPQSVEDRLAALEKRGNAFALSSGWTLVLVVPIIAVALGIALVHTNAVQDRQQARSNQQFRKAQIEANRKFQDATRLSARQSAYSINKSVCVLRTIAKAQIGRLELTKTKGYKEAEGFWLTILDNQVPVPSTFNCKSLPKHPPK